MLKEEFQGVSELLKAHAFLMYYLEASNLLFFMQRNVPLEH